MVRMFIQYSAVHRLFIAFVIGAVTAQGMWCSCLLGTACREVGSLCCTPLAETAPRETSACCAPQANAAGCCFTPPGKPLAISGMPPSSPQPHESPCTCHLHASNSPASLPPSPVRLDTSFSSGDFAGFLTFSIVTTDRSQELLRERWQGPPGSDARIQQCCWRC